ncbi:AQUAPORIN SIP1-1 [Salix purpurea]|uniref:AQUAPORIN SIP1-1 n=1 Tax=Salix purpurea TaxID=77065 RepID=A0A9Q0WAC4_SALPP|nr:AQUAPORIN SIP1-1 [Salix purpurea]
MRAVKAAMGDAVFTVMWVFVSSMFGLFTNLIVTALGLQTLVWAPVLANTSLIFTFVFLFNFLGEFLGGATFNPTGTASFYAAGVGGDSLLSMALRFPAQAAGSVGGALAILEVMPVQYKHMLGGPTLQVDLQTGGLAEGILTFLMTFAVLRRVYLYWSFHESCICFWVGICKQMAQHMGAVVCLLDLPLHRSDIGCLVMLGHLQLKNSFLVKELLVRIA